MGSTDSKGPPERLPLFFAFQDGQFGYQCESCDKRCCLEADQLCVTVEQWAGYDLATWGTLVVGASGNSVFVDSGQGGCPALAQSGYCMLHEEGGRLHKPVTCVLYPINVMVRTESFCAVAPRFTFVCPLVLDPPPGFAIARHSEIAQDIRHYYGDTLESLQLISIPSQNCVSMDSEQRMLEVVNASLGRRPLAAAICEASGELESDLLARSREALRLLDVDPDPKSSAGMDTLLPMVPSLRTAFYHLELLEIDVALLVGWRFVVAATPPGVAPGMRRIASVFRQFEELVGLAVRAHRPVRLEGPLRRPKGGIPEVALEVALVLRHAQRHPGRYTLSELLSRHVLATGIHRKLVLRELSRAGLRFE